MKGCMSEVFRSSFSYQVAVGNTISEYRQVDDIRKSKVVTKSSFPVAPSATHSASLGIMPPLLPLSSFMTPLLVPSKYLSIYSCPLPEEPNRLERQINILRGKFSGLSGCSAEKRIPPLFSCSTKYSLGSLPAASASRVICSGFLFSWGALGNQPKRSDLML